MDTHLPAVLDLFGASLQQGIFPDIFKIADVTPILKRPGTDDQLLYSYRPASNLPFLSTLLEHVVAETFPSHTEQMGLHETFQSPYKPNHSTETASLHVQDDTAPVLDKNCRVLLDMTDLPAAFDRADHCNFITLLHDNRNT